MGLDMYLTKKTSLPVSVLETIPETQELENVKKERITDIKIIEDVGYWRKANAMHKWFVDNIQDGDDNCKDYEVDLGSLERLLYLCLKVKENSELVDGKIVNGYTYTKDGLKVGNFEDGKIIKNPSTAIELLPTQNGFFFGNTDYNEFYLSNIQKTIDILMPLIKEIKEANSKGIYPEIYYYSSW